MKKLILSLLLICSITACTTEPTIETTTEQIIEQTTITETNYVYVICDVVDSYEELKDEIYTTNLVCDMPNGELHTYTIEDAPEGTIELVCFRTDNQDDYKAYEVVGVR